MSNVSVALETKTPYYPLIKIVFHGKTKVVEKIETSM